MEDVKNWMNILPDIMRCDGLIGMSLCRKHIIEGYKINYTPRRYFCKACFLDQSKNDREFAEPFSMDPVEIDSRYVLGANEGGDEESSYIQLCKHLPGYKWNFRSSPWWCYTVPLTLKQVCHIGLLGKYEDMDERSFEFYEEIPEIKPGDIIPVCEGVTIRVHESFVDPRNDKTDIAVKRFHREWRRAFPKDVETFKKEVKRLCKDLV
jgi:hypothetical protein